MRKPINETMPIATLIKNSNGSFTVKLTANLTPDDAKNFLTEFYREFAQKPNTKVTAVIK